MNISKAIWLIIIVVLLVSACKREAEAPKTAIKKASDSYVLDRPLGSFSDFIIVKTEMGDVVPQVIELDEIVADLGQYDVIIAAEAHNHATNHYVQSKLFSRLQAEFGNMTLSMEQFERDKQEIIDQYLASEIGEETLVFEAKAWPHYRASYRPLVEFAKANSLPVIAAEIPANLVSCISEKGPEFLISLPEKVRKWVAEDLDLSAGAYRDKFYAFMEAATGHGFPKNLGKQELQQKKQNRYAAQVSRDDTMAESITRHMADYPERKIFHITGSFHSAGLLGTPERIISRRPDLKIANIHPVLVSDPDNPSFSTEDLKQGQYLLLLYPVPKRFVQMKNINSFIKRTQDKLDENTCAY